MLIARALPIMRVYIKPGGQLPIMRVYIKPGGQRGYSGHCINMPQDVKELASVMPTICL